MLEIMKFSFNGFLVERTNLEQKDYAFSGISHVQTAQNTHIEFEYSLLKHATAVISESN